MNKKETSTIVVESPSKTSLCVNQDGRVLVADESIEAIAQRVLELLKKAGA